MTRFRAAWVVPIAGRPLPGAQVTVDDGRVVAVDAVPRGDAVDLGQVALLPGLVNAHVHLELSYLRGTIPPASCFTDWVRPVLRARRALADPHAPHILAAAARAIAEAVAYGTAAVGDVSNTLVTGRLLAEARLPALVFYELLGFNVSDPVAVVARARRAIDDQPPLRDVRFTLAAHAPYSVSPALFAALRGDLDQRRDDPSTVHLGESPEEVELLRTGRGPWRTLLEELGSWTDAWQPPGRGPVDYLDDLDMLRPRLLVVHGVQFGGDDLARLRTIGATLVSCPRSNAWVGVGAPPLEAAYAAGVRVAFGTDSLTSVEDLNLFAELRAARAIAPRVRARDLLESATLMGARALGLDRELGTIEAGKRAAVLAVRIPEAVSDVEEYLVGGVPSDAVTWVPAG